MRDAFLSLVRSYIGTPYHHQGRLPGVGMDCPAPLICAARELGIKPRDFDVTGYSREPDGVTLKTICDEHLIPISFNDAIPGDVLLCKFRNGHPRHLGILTDANPKRRYWIEAESVRHQKVIEGRLVFGTQYMQLVQAYRVPGL